MHTLELHGLIPNEPTEKLAKFQEDFSKPDDGSVRKKGPGGIFRNIVTVTDQSKNGRPALDRMIIELFIG